MIQDGVIIYEAHNVTFWNWQFESEFLTTAILAIMSTMLAYQLRAACFNIEFGSKERGTATACDIHKLMLTEHSSSPLDIISAVARHDSLDRLRFNTSLPENERIDRRDTKISKGVTFSLIILLMVSPLFNLVSIFMTLQGDKTMTFNQANAGGVTLGVDDSNKIPRDIEKHKFRFQNISSICDRIPTRVVGPVTALVSFSRCVNLQIPVGVSLDGTEIRLLVETTYQGQINVSVVTLPSDIPVSAAIHVDMAARGELFRIQPTLQLESAAKLIDTGQKKLGEFCTSATQNNSSRLLDTESSNGIFRASKDFRCSLPGANEFTDVVFSMSRVALVNYYATKVVNVDDINQEADSAPEYFDAGGLPFILRRARNVNFLPMTLVLFLSFLVRILTGWIFNNDIDEGVEAILRHRLRIAPQESLLRSSRVVTYNNNNNHGSGIMTQSNLRRVPHNQKDGKGTNKADRKQEVKEGDDRYAEDFFSTLSSED